MLTIQLSGQLSPDCYRHIALQPELACRLPLLISAHEGFFHEPNQLFVFSSCLLASVAVVTILANLVAAENVYYDPVRFGDLAKPSVSVAASLLDPEVGLPFLLLSHKWRPL